MSRKKRSKPKARTTYVTLDMGRPVTANGLRLDPKTGEFSLLYDEKKLKSKRVYADTGYERIKGHKILNKVQLSPDELYANVNRILEQFDFIYAIDTNCKTINSAMISVTGVVGGANLKPSIPEHTAIRYRSLKCIELLNPKGKFENLAWKIVVEMIQAAPNYSKNDRIALIADSDLSNIESYNSQSKPIYGEFCLPQNYQLIYASSDSGKENIANQMIALADKSANKIFEILMEGHQVHEYEVVANKPYTHIRIWEPTHNNPNQSTS